MTKSKQWTTPGEIIPEEGERFFLLVDPTDSFMKESVGALLNAEGEVLPEGKVCGDGETRYFIPVVKHAQATVLKNPKNLPRSVELWHTTKETIRPVRYDLSPTSYYIVPPAELSGMEQLLRKNRRLQKITIVVGGSLSALTTNDRDVADRAVDALRKLCSEERWEAVRFFKSKGGPYVLCNQAFNRIPVVAKKRN